MYSPSPSPPTPNPQTPTPIPTPALGTQGSGALSSGSVHSPERLWQICGHSEGQMHALSSQHGCGCVRQ